MHQAIGRRHRRFAFDGKRRRRDHDDQGQNDGAPIPFFLSFSTSLTGSLLIIHKDVKKRLGRPMGMSQDVIALAEYGAIYSGDDGIAATGAENARMAQTDAVAYGDADMAVQYRRPAPESASPVSGRGARIGKDA